MKISNKSILFHLFKLYMLANIQLYVIYNDIFVEHYWMAIFLEFCNSFVELVCNVFIFFRISNK